MTSPVNLAFSSNQSRTAPLLRSRGWLWIALLAGFGLQIGCGTTTKRLATEQLLMSDAVDRAIAEIDFRSLTGKRVFLDTLYLHSVKGVGFVNSEYIISSLRQQLTAARCLIQDTREAAEVIVEPRVGALGTDGHEVVYGLPQSGSITSAASIISSTPLPSIPEVSFGKSNAQSGIAKIIVYAYDRQSREPIWQSGIAKAESTSRDTWLMGAGPFQKGSIYDGMRFAGEEIPSQLPALNDEHGDQGATTVRQVVPFQSEYVFSRPKPAEDAAEEETPEKERVTNKPKPEAEGEAKQVQTASHAEPVSSE
jgi:hypothetical protein